MISQGTIRHRDLIRHMRRGATVLTANKRLSRSLRADFERLMISEGKEAWHTPGVMPFPAWLNEMYGRVALFESLPRLMSAEQEVRLWASIIGQDRYPLIRLDAAARQARDSWERLRDWDLDTGHPAFSMTEDSKAFQGWARQFRAHCAESGLASASDLAGLLLPFLGKADMELPEHVFLAGFYHLSPAQLQCVEALQESGCVVSWVEIEGVDSRGVRVEAADAADETRSVARWARRTLDEDARARIGIVAPDLSARRDLLEYELGRWLQPAGQAPGETAPERCWNISLGRSLARQPIVRTALELLELMIFPLRLDRLGALLRSPHWAMPDEFGERLREAGRRAQLDQRLRQMGDPDLTLGWIMYLTGQDDPDDQPEPWVSHRLHDRLKKLAASYRALPEKAACSDWANQFNRWLTTAGWAEGRALDSAEYQATEALNDVFSQFAGLDEFTAADIERRQALDLLQGQVESTVFQPQSADVPVQVLGLHEANGQRFDHLWIMGMHDAAWPRAPGPDPFIPLRLQREHGMPHTSPGQELEWSRTVTRQLLHAAPNAIVSHPAQQGNEKRACSPLLASLPVVMMKELLPASEETWFKHIAKPKLLQSRSNPPRVDLASVPAKGGTGIFRHQAICPFRAFAHHRLDARPLEEATPGIGPIGRGNLFHEVMERFWAEVTTQENLLALPAAELRSKLSDAIEGAIEKERQRSPLKMRPRICAVEARRLQQLSLAWLEVEKRRAPFTVVQREERQDCELGGLDFRIKVDRVDRLEDGRLVVIDYKTGQVNPGDWFGERPLDPQLPLYSATRGQEDVAAVAFAQARPDNVAFRGVVAESGLLPDLPPGRGRLKDACDDLSATLEEWSAVMKRLATEFVAGEATIDPVNGVASCKQTYCKLASLCRVGEMAASDITGGDDDD